MNDETLDKLLEAVKKKAVGYMTTETVDEYSLLDGELSIVKRKVTQKEVPPDMTAVKFLIEETKGDKYSEMSLEELNLEKARLLKLLKEAENATGKNKSQNQV